MTAKRMVARRERRCERPGRSSSSPGTRATRTPCQRRRCSAQQAAGQAGDDEHRTEADDGVIARVDWPPLLPQLVGHEPDPARGTAGSLPRRRRWTRRRRRPSRRRAIFKTSATPKTTERRGLSRRWIAASSGVVRKNSSGPTSIPPPRLEARRSSSRRRTRRGRPGPRLPAAHARGTAALSRPDSSALRGAGQGARHDTPVHHAPSAWPFARSCSPARDTRRSRSPTGWPSRSPTCPPLEAVDRSVPAVVRPGHPHERAARARAGGGGRRTARAWPTWWRSRRAPPGLMLVLRLVGGTGPVAVPSFTFSASAHAIAWNGRTPRFVECDPDTFQLDVDGRGHRAGPPRCWPPTSSARRAMWPRSTALAAGTARGLRRRPRPRRDRARAPGRWLRRGRGVQPQPDQAARPRARVGWSPPTTRRSRDDVRIGRDYANPGDYDTRFVGLNARMSEFHAAMALESLEPARRVTSPTAASSPRRYVDGLAAVPGIRTQAIAAGDESTYKDFTIAVDPDSSG